MTRSRHPLRSRLVRSALLVALGLALAGCGGGGGSAAAPAAPSPAANPSGSSRDIVFYADLRPAVPDALKPGSPPDKWLRVSERIASLRRVADLAGGDFIFPIPAGDQPSLDRLAAMYGGYLSTQPRGAKLGTFAVPGNHEMIATGEPRFLQAWQAALGDGRPDWWKIDIEGIHVIGLSTDEPGYEGRVPPAELRDLRRWLAGFGRDDWVVVMLHHPLYDPEPDAAWSAAGGYAGERDALARIFARGGVDLVLQGDIHNFRLHPQPISVAGRTYGLPYVTCGQAGAPWYPVDKQGPLHPRDSGRGGDVAGYLVLRPVGGGSPPAVASASSAASPLPAASRSPRALALDYVWTTSSDGWRTVDGWQTQTLYRVLTAIPAAR